ncbi:hypothetical protein BB559_005599, partial [Furculomyces boomerangus]
LVVSPLDWLRVSLGSIPGQVGCLAWWSERGLGRSELSYYVWEPTNQRKTSSGVLTEEQQPRTVPMLDG